MALGDRQKRRKRNTKAIEPAAFAGQIKICPFCSGTNHDYKYLNNHKCDQPRYKCKTCHKLFSANRMRPKVFFNGYKKKNTVEQERLVDQMLLAQSSQELDTGTGEFSSTYDPSLEDTSRELVAANNPSNETCESGIQYEPQATPQGNRDDPSTEQNDASNYCNYELTNQQANASIYRPGYSLATRQTYDPSLEVMRMELVTNNPSNGTCKCGIEYPLLVAPLKNSHYFSNEQNNAPVYN